MGGPAESRYRRGRREARARKGEAENDAPTLKKIPATKLPFGVTRLTNDEGTRDYITCIPKERLFTQGIPAEAIVGVLLRPLEPGESITPENFAANDVSF